MFLFLFSVIIVLAAALFMVYFYPVSPSPQTVNFDKHVRDRKLQRKNPVPFSQAVFLSPEEDSPAVRLSMGTVIIYDIAGNEISRLAAAVSESGWIALPARLCVGGYHWYFYSADGEKQEIFGGILGDHDDIGIWQLKNPGRLSGPPISPVSLEQPVTWVSIISEKHARMRRLSILSEQENVYHIFMDESLGEPGVLIQDQKIVGWTLGGTKGAGYLWKGLDESNLVYELSVDDFYRLTFENSREEQFIIAYAQEETNPVKQLELFAAGFRLAPMLFDENTPARLKSGAVVIKMRSLILQIRGDGIYHDIAAIVDSRVLAAVGDVSFLTDVLSFDDSSNQPSVSIDTIENVLAEPGNFNENQMVQIRQFQKELYGKWLTRLMHENNYSKGLAVYQQAADSIGNDPGVHLMGVKFALVFNDWKTAEEILASHQFPVDLTDQVRAMEGQIADLKSQENKIVIRFTPGAGRIPVTGVLNNQMYQDFFVDTGASMVTIPGAAAQRLGIEIDSSSPVQQLITAGGVIQAPQIHLDTIEINGWTEYNVTAYIVDMPDKAGFGLLGLNFLNRFQMDLNTKAGILTLAPR